MGESMTAENKKTLIEGLKQFGLNPEDWLLKRVGPLKFKLQHRKDASFIFLGQGELRNTTPQWASLQLISL